MHPWIELENLDEVSAYYLDLLPHHDFEKLLANTGKQVAKRFALLSVQQRKHPYAKGKWSPAQVLMHLIDVEQIFCYRILRIAREPNVSLQGFAPEKFTKHYLKDTTPYDQLIKQFELQRQFTIKTVLRLSKENLTSKGIIEGIMIQAITLVLRISAHDLHHLQLIEKYYPILTKNSKS